MPPFFLPGEHLDLGFGRSLFGGLKERGTVVIQPGFPGLLLLHRLQVLRGDVAPLLIGQVAAEEVLKGASGLPGGMAAGSIFTALFPQLEPEVEAQHFGRVHELVDGGLVVQVQEPAHLPGIAVE